MTEFDFIRSILAPLARGASGAAGLRDDVAELPQRADARLIVTTDQMSEGVHYVRGASLRKVAQKLLRRNISDIIAKGGQPFSYQLAIAWPRGSDLAPLRDFADGLAADQELYDIDLTGGDCAAILGPAHFSVTMVGWVGARGPVRRAGVKPGDVIVVTGPIGDAGLGLQLAQGARIAPAPIAEALIARYETPEPPVALAPLIARFATGAIDISDGLIADLRQLAIASTTTISLDLAQLPLSAQARTFLGVEAGSLDALRWLASAGDDYQIALGVAPADLEDFTAAAAQLGFAITPIGAALAARSSEHLQQLFRGAPIAGDWGGYQHFSAPE